MTDPLDWLAEVEAERRRAGLDRVPLVRSAATPGRVRLGDRWLVNFASNDYLGLAGDPRLAEAAARAAAVHGWGAGASPLVTGWTAAHEELAAALAAFEEVEAVALYPTGFAANLGAITALVGAEDAVYLDRLDHASLVAGAKLAGASLRVYPHNDAARLGSILARDRGRFRRSLIATDGVFSMDGDLAPLADLADLAERFGAILLVDEAHGTGVHGPEGRGSAAACGVADRVPVRVGTLSKALGSIGGFVAGSARLIRHVWNHSPSLIYSTGLPAAAAAAATTALAISQAEPWRRQRCLALADGLRDRLRTIGRGPGESTGPIVPLVVGPPDVAVAWAGGLRDRGMVVGAIRPPTVPRGTSRLRISLTAAHDDAEVAALADALAALADPGRGGPSPSRTD